MNGYIGLDFATQSARAIVINDSAQILTRISTELEPVITIGKSRTQNPASWISALNFLLKSVAEFCEANSVTPVALSMTATSGTFLLTAEKNVPTTAAIMYNDGTADSPLERAALLNQTETYFKHVPEYLISYLTGSEKIPADWSHALKSGFDLDTKAWNVKTNLKLPDVVAPGEYLGEISDSFPLKGLKIFAGMTDGCTGQISAGGSRVGSAVSTIGTTLVLKLVSDRNISGPGFYSHLLPNETWLSGGASNLGGISLNRFGDLDKLNRLAENYGPANRVVYPLEGVGERFPIADPALIKLESDKPTNTVEEFRSILEGIAFAEKYAYQILHNAGGPNLKTLNTVGGGSKSKLWSEIRATVLDLEIVSQSEAGSDLGAAMIALAGYRGGNLSEQLAKIPLQSGEIIYPNSNQKNKLNENYSRFLELIHRSHKDL